MDIYDSIMDIRNCIMDIHNSIRYTYNSIMGNLVCLKIRKFSMCNYSTQNAFILNVHSSIMNGIHNSIVWIFIMQLWTSEIVNNFECP